MVTKLNFRRYAFFAVLGALFLSFCVTLFIYYSSLYTYHNRVDIYSKKISKEVWSMDRSSVQRYLDLLRCLGDYKKIIIVEPDGTVFSSSHAKRLAGLDEILEPISLIRVWDKRVEIRYHDKLIAYFVAEKYFRLLPVLLKVALFSSLVSFFITLFGYLFAHDRSLQRRLRTKRALLRTRERRFEDLLDSLSEAIGEVDLGRKLCYCNASLEKFVGDRALDKVFINFFPKKSQEVVAVALDRAFAGEECALDEFYLDQESQQALLLRFVPIYEHGRINSVLVAGWDISEQLQLQQQLQQKQKVNKLGLMAGGVAHDLSNLLSEIVGYSDYLLLESSEQDREYQMVRSIHQAGFQAAELVADWLVIVQERNMHRADLSEIVEKYFLSPECCQLREDNQQIHYSTAFTKESLPLLCVEMQLEKVIHNLFINAMGSLRHSGMIAIKTMLIKFDVPFFCRGKELPVGEYACLRVRDNGSGISESTTKLLFDPFYSRKMGKGGMGMILIGEVVDNHRGGIQVFGSETGTQIDIFFPLNPDGSAAEERVDGSC